MLFIFSYSFETIFTLEKMMGSPPERKRRNEVLKSGILFIWLGLMYNLILNLFNEFSIGIWGWNLILYIGFAKIIIYFTFKLIRWARLVVGLGILFATEFLRELLYINRSINIVFEILYFFIVTPYPKFALLPYASLCIFASTFSELIYQAKILESKKAIMNSIKSTIRYGLIFIILGFLLSLIDLDPFVTSETVSSLKYPFIDNLPILGDFDFQYIPYMPEFLLRGTPSYIFFVLGSMILLLGLILYWNEGLTGFTQKLNRVFKGLGCFGKFSLTLIFIQYVFLPLFVFKVNLFIYIPLFVLSMIIFAYIIYIWNKYANGKMSIEWIIKRVI
jgi:hypothetical protein